jgi:RHS repeat-associated protein
MFVEGKQSMRGKTESCTVAARVASAMLVVASTVPTMTLAQPAAPQWSEPAAAHESVSSSERVEVDDSRLAPSDRAVLAEEMLPEGERERIRAMLPERDLTEPSEGASPLTLPVGGPHSAATPQALPLPRGEGSIQGMGESFSASLSTGALSFTVPISLPPGRNGLTPPLALGYSSGGGSSDVGFGWSFGVGAITRQTDRGLPRYVDRARYHPEEDHFVYDGSEELVPVDSALMSTLDGGVIPAELAGWQEYRAHVEGHFMRFFRAPDSTRWVVQAPDGTRYDLGLQPATEGPTWAASASVRSLVRSPDGARTASWALVRTTDPHGSTIHYVYSQDGGERYLSDVYYLSPASCAGGSADATRRCSASSDEYGVRVHLVYEDRTDPTTSHRSGWEMRSAWRLRRLEITAAGEAVGSRTLVRRYHFAYDARSYHSLLTSVTLEGRPESLDAGTGAMVGDAHVPEASLGDAIVGATLPPMVFHYTGESALGHGVDGFPALDSERHHGAFSPREGAGDLRADLYDVNSDGLDDLIVTDPARYRTTDGGPAVGVYFNGFSGPDAAPSVAGNFSEPIAVALPPGLADTMQLTNPNLVAMDVNGDGRSDLLHMPRERAYGYFTPVRAPGNHASPADQGWQFTYLDVDTGDLDPRIDLSRDGDRIRVLDVNADGLVDVVRTSGDAIETWLNLGWHEGGDGRFGSATYGPSGWTLSTEPLESCLPAAGAPVSFDDPEVRLADMDGDGLQDIVRISPGSVVWWPGLGYGRFGQACEPGVARAAPVVMRAPRDLGAGFDTIYLADVDSDGASDLVRLGEDVLDVWFNMGGTGFSRRSTASGLRWSRDLDRVIRFADIDGSGSLDVVFARARQWEWVDPMGGRRPRLLSRVDNGLGATSTFAYGSTSEDYLRDLAAAEACASPDCEAFLWQGRDDGQCDTLASAAAGACVVRSTGAPMSSTVVRASETTDRLGVLGATDQITRNEYAYHDGYYEGIEQESRGFGATDLRSIGGVGQGTSTTRSWMHQGRRPRSIAGDRLAENPWEALKGATHLTETWEESTGRYLGTSHTSYRAHRLAIGLDGREVVWAFASRVDEVRYDHTTAWVPAAPGAHVPFYGGTGTDYPAVERYLVSSGGIAVDADAPGWSEPLTLRSAGYYAVLATTTDQVDHVGHVIERTAWGRVHGEWSEPLAHAEEVVSHSGSTLVDAARWIWRPTDAWTSGHGSTARLHWTTLEYAAGAIDPTRTVSHLTIPRAYEFAGDADGSEAFTQSAEDGITSFVYDAWGQSTATCAGAPVATDAASCLGYDTVVRDSAYQQVVEQESVTTDSTGHALRWTGIGDRGLGTYTSTTDPRGASSQIGYDGLGRPTFVRVPNVRGCEGATLPTTRISYDVTPDAATRPLSRFEVVSFRDCHDPSDVGIQRTYVDGLGRARASLVRTDAPHAWARAGLTDFTPRGLPYRTSGAAFIDAAEPNEATVLSPAGEEWASTGYDAFGRVWYTQPLGASYTERSWRSYGAMVVVECDPFDLFSTGAHVGAGTCTIVRSDGQGRVEDTIIQQRHEIGGAIENVRLWPTYRADGSLVSLERVVTADHAARALAAPSVSSRVARTFAVDSQGRRIGSTDGDTDARRAGTTEANRSWRYLWSRLGNLVAVRDPRGCGQNFYYDRAGRLVGEDYVACGESEPWRDVGEMTVPAGSIALGPIAAPRSVEVRTFYDDYPAWVAGDLMPPAWSTSALGSVTAVADRGSRSVVAYDARGLASWTARQMALLPSAPAAPATSSAALPSVAASTGVTRVPRVYDEASTYVAEASFDHAGRARSRALPFDPDFEGSSAPSVSGQIAYDQRGLPRSVSVEIDGDVHPVLTGATYDRDGQMLEMVWGDDAGGTRAPSRTSVRYDARRRPDRLTTTRAPTGVPSTTRPLSRVSVVMDQDLDFDAMGNLLRVRDLRPTSEWPVGQRPQSVELTYDALWHVVGAEYAYAGDAGAVTDLANDYRDAVLALDAVDPMRERPAPMVSAAPTGRVMSLTWDYDFLGNVTEWTDDAHAFHERSLDRITNGVDEAGGRPSALRVATSIASTPHAYGAADRGGWLEVDYGDSGNVSAVTVHGQCHDASATAMCVDTSGTVDARRAALRTGCRCDREQHYQYRFDELNQIVDARRYDRPGSGAWVLAANLRYGYDGSSQRTVKEVRDTLGATRYALWPYPGDYERRGLARGTGRYEATAGTETSYLVGGARLVWQDGDPALGLDPEHRLTLPVADLLGTSSAVIDLASGELVESSTYYPNGARETLRSSDATHVPLEPSGFTGKEADEEVGLTYFGMRYLMPHLGRWASPDPLQIHAEGGGEVMNSYHYIGGNLLQSRDPIGLDDINAIGSCKLHDQPTISVDTKFVPNLHWNERRQEFDHPASMGTADPIAPGSVVIGADSMGRGGNVLSPAQMEPYYRYIAMQNAQASPLAGVSGLVAQAAGGSPRGIALSSSVGGFAGALAPVAMGLGGGGTGGVSGAPTTTGGRVARGLVDGQPSPVGMFRIDVSRIGVPSTGRVFLTEAGDAFGTNARQASFAPGYTDIVAHSDGHRLYSSASGGSMSWTEAARRVSESPDYLGGPIRILGCRITAPGATAGYRAADTFGNPVIGPDDILWAFPDGSLTIGQGQSDNDGSFQSRMPSR